MRSVDRWFGAGVAVWVCGVLAAGSVVLAFYGPAKAGAMMSAAPMLALTAVLAVGVSVVGIRALSRRLVCSALLHLGCACVMVGWLAGRLAERFASGATPWGGYLSLVDGYVSNRLSDGQKMVGELPFTVRLMKFSIDRYEPSAVDREEGRLPPVREYSSLVLISEPGKKPYACKIRVNHPARVAGYHIYQNSWREVVDDDNRPVWVTTLQFIRDPGLPLVYAGFVVLFAGVLTFTLRMAALGGRGAGVGEVAP